MTSSTKPKAHKICWSTEMLFLRYPDLQTYRPTHHITTLTYQGKSNNWQKGCHTLHTGCLIPVLRYTNLKYLWSVTDSTTWSSIKLFKCRTVYTVVPKISPFYYLNDSQKWINFRIHIYLTKLLNYYWSDHILKMLRYYFVKCRTGSPNQNEYYHTKMDGFKNSWLLCCVATHIS